MTADQWGCLEKGMPSVFEKNSAEKHTVSNEACPSPRDMYDGMTLGIPEIDELVQEWSFPGGRRLFLCTGAQWEISCSYSINPHGEQGETSLLDYNHMLKRGICNEVKGGKI